MPCSPPASSPGVRAADSSSQIALRASIEIDQNQWDAAGKTLDEILAINPQSTQAIALQATIAWLRDDTKAYDAAKAMARQSFGLGIKVWIDSAAAIGYVQADGSRQTITESS